MKTNRVHNLTTSFVLPLLGWNRAVFKPYLIDAYIQHKGVPHFTKDHVFVLLRWSDEDRFKKLEEVLTTHPTHVSTYEPYEGGNYVMHVFKVKDVVLDDYNLFLKGKYSQMSVKAKKLILASAKANGVTSQILNKSANLREVQEQNVGQELPKDAEVWPKLRDKHIINNEIFDEETPLED